MPTLVKRSLQGHEEIIESGMKSFVDVGRSLMAIRDERLYESDYDSFDQYCKKRWGFSKNRATQLIGSTEVISNISEVTIVTTETKKSGGKSQIPLPQNEAQARAVAAVSQDPEEQVEVWKAAVETAPKDDEGKPQVTAAHVKRAAEAVLGGKPANDLPKTTREPGEDAPEKRHTEPPREEPNPFDAPLAGVDWVLQTAVPKVQEYAILAERALASGKGDFSPRKIESLIRQVHESFQGIRGVIANAQQKARRK